MTMTYEDALVEAFPAVDAGVQPFGSRVLVQIRTPKTTTAGGISASSSDAAKKLTPIEQVSSLVSSIDREDGVFSICI